jgi:hypothetical protein
MKSTFLFKFFYMVEKEWQETYKDVQGTTIYFLQWIVIKCRHFSCGGRVLPKNSKLLH